MARPETSGISYFSYDVDLDQDDKLQMIIGEFGFKGEVVFTKLLAWIYKFNGYYMKWDEGEQLKFAKRFAYLGTSVNLHNEVVVRCLKWGLFDKNLFSAFQILSSARIQNTWLDATKRRKNAVVDPRFRLYVDVEYTFTPEMLTSEQQSKVNKRELNYTMDAPELEPFNEADRKKIIHLIEWLKFNTPRVLQLETPFKVKELHRIATELDINRAKSTLISMQNCKPLLQKYTSPYLTMVNWYNRTENERKH